MRHLSVTGERAVSDLAQRHGFSPEAVATMLGALYDGNGTLAQFRHAEFGGSGQWMRGGMTMVGDMFNTSLKSRVDALCADLAALLEREPNLIAAPSGPSGAAPAGAAASQAAWWPGDLGVPTSTGTQNTLRYAYFAQSRRLAIDLSGTVTVYDTLDHKIGGFAQQQSTSGSLSFSSQHGLVDVNSLPIVSVNGVPQHQRQPTPAAPSPPSDAPLPASSTGPDIDIVGTIEKLADLRAKGILSDEEFNAKKTDLLRRL